MVLFRFAISPFKSSEEISLLICWFFDNGSMNEAHFANMGPALAERIVKANID